MFDLGVVFKPVRRLFYEVLVYGLYRELEVPQILETTKATW
jgi:hypothetical protein